MGFSTNRKLQFIYNQRRQLNIDESRTTMKRRTAIVLQLLVFVMFSILAAKSLRGISDINSQLLQSRLSQSQINSSQDQVNNEVKIELCKNEYYGKRANRELDRQIKDLRHTLHNETSLVFPSLIKRTMSAVVGVTNSANPVNQVNGSGFVIDAANGYIMTAKHVVDRDLSTYNTSDGIFVKYEVELTCGDRIKVERIYKYLKDDLAILLVDIEDPNYCLVSELQIANVTNLTNTPKRGDIVLVLGNPFSFLFSASAGIISNPNSKHVMHPDWNYVERVQYDAMSNPGNSGCAVINICGEVIGVYVTSGWVVRQNSGVNFAVHIKAISNCIAQFTEWIAVFNSQQNNKIVESENS